MKSASQLLAKRGVFVGSVYLLLSLQLALTAAVVSYLRAHPDVYVQIHRYFWLWFLCSIVLIFVLAWVDMPVILKGLLFTVFSVLLGFNSIAATRFVSVDMIRAAIYSTVGVFVVMSVLGIVLYLIGIDLSFMLLGLLVVLMGLVIAWIVTAFVGISSTGRRVMLAIGIGLFSLFVAVDTNRMMSPGYPEDVVSAALQLYLDVLNLFTHFVGSDS